MTSPGEPSAVVAGLLVRAAADSGVSSGALGLELERALVTLGSVVVVVCLVSVLVPGPPSVLAAERGVFLGAPWLELEWAVVAVGSVVVVLRLALVSGPPSVVAADGGVFLGALRLESAPSALVDGLTLWAKTLSWKPPNTKDTDASSTPATTPRFVTNAGGPGLWPGT
ncbi:MAG: hypothetical protein M3404_00150 [Actinomycetota bacterium]|nr:hypothetical protein [Actinomycetota bacterium]